MSMDNVNAKAGSDPSPVRQQTALGPIEYIDIGSGPVVVAIHGAMGGCDQSLILAKTVLNGGYRILAVSRPGFLGTPTGSGSSPVEQAALVAALLGALDIPKASLIAISGGGPAALSFCLQYPERCEKLVLISTATKPNTFKIPFRFNFVKLLARFPAITEKMRKNAANNIEKLVKKSVKDPRWRKQLLDDQESLALYTELTLSTFDKMDRRIRGSENDFRNTGESAYPLENLKVPTLIVHGTADPFVNFSEHALEASKRIPNCKLLMLPGGEHAAIFTHRNPARQGVAAFLDGS